MTESFLRKAARGSFLVLCLTFALVLSACSLCPASSGNAASDTTPRTAQIQIDCTRTVISGRYDVDVSVDGGTVGSVEFNNKATFEVKLTKGQHELALKKADSDHPEGKTTFTVENEGDRFSYHVKLTSDTIEVEPVEETENKATDSQVVSYGRCSFEAPSTWEVKDADDGKYVYSEYGGLIYLRSSEISFDHSLADTFYEDFLTGAEENGRITITSEVVKLKVGDTDAFRNGMEFRSDDARFIGAMESIVIEGEWYTISFAMPEAVYSTYESDIATVLDSIKLDEPQAQAPEDGSGQD